jgi:hypothetical protein
MLAVAVDVVELQDLAEPVAVAVEVFTLFLQELLERQIPGVAVVAVAILAGAVKAAVPVSSSSSAINKVRHE